MGPALEAVVLGRRTAWVLNCLQTLRLPARAKGVLDAEGTAAVQGACRLEQEVDAGGKGPEGEAQVWTDKGALVPGCVTGDEKRGST